jgi:hypothetical protein
MTMAKRARQAVTLDGERRRLEAAVRDLTRRVTALEEGRRQTAAPEGPAAQLPADPYTRVILDELRAVPPEAERIEGMIGMAGLMWACGRDPDRDMASRTAVAFLPEAWKADLRAAAQYLAAIASVPRLQLLKALFIGRRSAPELMELTGLTKGQTYGNLSKLLLLGLVRQPEREQYDITWLGCDFLAIALVAGGDVVGPHAASRLEAPRPAESLALEAPSG